MIVVDFTELGAAAYMVALYETAMASIRAGLQVLCAAGGPVEATYEAIAPAMAAASNMLRRYGREIDAALRGVS